MTLLTSQQINALKMSEKIRLIHDAMESLCSDFQKSESHSKILEERYPLGSSLDDVSASMFVWFEDVQENETKIPVIQERSKLEILHSDTFKTAFKDKDATIFVKYFNNDRGAHVDYVFKWKCEDGQIMYNGVTFYQTYDLVSHEEAIQHFINDTFAEEDAWCWTEESEFIEWMCQS